MVLHEKRIFKTHLSAFPYEHWFQFIGNSELQPHLTHILRNREGVTISPQITIHLTATSKFKY